MVLRKGKQKDICDMESLAAVLLENTELALLWATVFGESEINRLQKWLNNVNPKTVSEIEFVLRVRNAIRGIDLKSWKIIKIPLCSEMNIKSYSDSDGLICPGMSIEKLTAIVSKMFSDEMQTAEIATKEEVDILKAYKIATNVISLSRICECGKDVNNPREFYRCGEKIAFSGGKIWPITDVQIVKDPMVTIEAYDYLVFVIKNK